MWVTSLHSSQVMSSNKSPVRSLTFHRNGAEVRLADVLGSEIGHGDRYTTHADQSVRLYSGDDMESLAVTGVDDFLAGVPAIHEHVN